MEETFSTTAIILKRDPYREFDSRVFVYTPEHGKIDLIARGTGRRNSKLVAHIEPFNCVDLMVILGRNKKYLGAVATNNCQTIIKNDFNKIFWTGSAFAVFNSLVREDHGDPDLFYLLQEFLLAMNKSSKSEELVANYFYLKLLALLGYRPELNNCLHCGQKIMAGANHFVFSRGGIFCGACADKIKREDFALKVSDNCLKLMRQVLRVEFADLEALVIGPAIALEFQKLSLAILRHQQS